MRKPTVNKDQDKPFKTGFTMTKQSFVKARIESRERDKRLTRLINSSP
jgi:hypothetical protein